MISGALPEPEVADVCSVLVTLATGSGGAEVSGGEETDVDGPVDEVVVVVEPHGDVGEPPPARVVVVVVLVADVLMADGWVVVVVVVVEEQVDEGLPLPALAAGTAEVPGDVGAVVCRERGLWIRALPVPVPAPALAPAPPPVLPWGAPGAAVVGGLLGPELQIELKFGAVRGPGSLGRPVPGFWNRHPSTSPGVTRPKAPVEAYVHPVDAPVKYDQ